MRKIQYIKVGFFDKLKISSIFLIFSNCHSRFLQKSLKIVKDFPLFLFNFCKSAITFLEKAENQQHFLNLFKLSSRFFQKSLKNVKEFPLFLFNFCKSVITFFLNSNLLPFFEILKNSHFFRSVFLKF